MMKKTKSILLLIAFIVFFLLCSENVIAISWNFLFSDKPYQINIENSAYILDESQICAVFTDFVDLHQLSHNDLAHIPNYLLIQLKNKGNKGAWGSLIIKVNKMDYIELQIPFLSANMSKFQNYLIPFTRPLPRDDNAPAINVEWNKLYSK